MPFPFIALLFAAVSFISSTFLNRGPKQQKPKPAGLNDWQFPTSEEARDIPYVAGNVKLFPNLTYFGDVEARPIVKTISRIWLGFGVPDIKKQQTIGFRYNVGMEIGLCFGPGVKLKRLTMDDKELFLGSLIGAPATTTILKETLFGGEEQDGEGGVNVVLDFYEGNSSQIANPYMATRYPRQSGHRDVAYAVWRGPSGGPIYQGGKYVSGGGYVGKAPQIRPLAFYLERMPDFLGTAYAAIGNDANPANILYDLTTSKLFGGGLSSGKINGPSFTAAAQTLFNEGLGASVIWERSGSLSEPVQQLVDIMDAALYMDLRTGLITLKLIRNDYNPLTLLELNDDIVTDIADFSRGSWTDTKNEYRLMYTARADDYKPKPAFAQDLANQRIRNATDAAQAQYDYIAEAAIAQKLAYRNLRTTALPLMRARLTCNRYAADLTPGAVFRWSTTKLRPNFSNKVMRVLKVNYGRLTDSKIEIDVVEDVFALGGTIYISPPSSAYSDPIGQPTVSPNVIVFEQPYFYSGDGNRIGSFVRQPSGSHLAYSVNTSVDAGANYSLIATDQFFTPVGTLDAAYSMNTADLDTVGFDVNDLAGVNSIFNNLASDVAQGAGVFYFEDTGEIAAFETVTYNSGTGKYHLSNIWRGLFDTVPAPHASGSRVWFYAFGGYLGDLTYADGQALKLKHLPRNANGEVALTAATAYDLTISSRRLKPYPIAGLRINTSYTAATHTGNVVLDWNRRNRLTQVGVIKQLDADAAPEASTVFELKIKNNLGSVIHTEAALTGTTFTYTTAQELLDNAGVLSPTLTFEIKAIRGGTDESVVYRKTTTRV